MEERYYATGRRKTSVARVWLMQGSGKVLVNRNDVTQYFSEMQILPSPSRVNSTSGAQSRAAASVARRARCVTAWRARCWSRTTSTASRCATAAS